ncbi:hypothetical protein H8S37_04190 [Mediterraneibacter sp. NSJ-55]|uniref:Uncharacterized protein n=1 Tax=Mediterraneibacter hominis TaxID=2763054 RepID=A0A923LGZ7_9FIRM|nr:hypothetical protein [Mediterraneibacter hominis]MBC5688133.1 hypothetical protein [Mediterraneibacter hominis]
MKIKAQDGNVYEAYNIEMNMCVLKCQNVKDRRKKHILGKYKDLERACKVMAEAVCCESEYYEMPEE